LDVGGAQWLAAMPHSPIYLFRDDPGDASHVLAFYGDHGVGEALDDLLFLLGRDTPSMSLTLMSGIAPLLS
jgi:hypothetical protein